MECPHCGASDFLWSGGGYKCLRCHKPYQRPNQLPAGYDPNRVTDRMPNGDTGYGVVPGAANTPGRDFNRGYLEAVAGQLVAGELTYGLAVRTVALSAPVVYSRKAMRRGLADRG